MNYENIAYLSRVMVEIQGGRFKWIDSNAVGDEALMVKQNESFECGGFCVKVVQLKLWA